MNLAYILAGSRGNKWYSTITGSVNPYESDKNLIIKLLSHLFITK